MRGETRSDRSTTLPGRGLLIRIRESALSCAVSTLVLSSAASAECIDYENYFHAVGAAKIPGRAYGVALRDHLAFVGGGTSGLHVVDISNPAEMRAVGSVETPGTARGVALSGYFAYVADDLFGLVVVDVSDPVSPQLVGQVDTAGSARTVALAGDLAYVADASNGLVVVDVSNPSSPQIVGHVDTPGSAEDVELSGAWAYVADYTSGLQVVDIATPESPQIAASFGSFGRWNAVAISGSTLYLAVDHPVNDPPFSSYGSLKIVDVSTPTAPFFLNSFFRTSPAKDVAVSDHYAYVSTSRGLTVVDVDEPQNPRIAGILGFGDTSPGSIAFAHGLVYVTDFIQDLVAVDTSTFKTVPVLGQMDAWSTHSMTISGNYAYVVTRDHGFRVVSIEDPLNLQPLGLLGAGGFEVAVAGDIALLADGAIGVSTLDVSNPSAPTFLATVDTPDIADAVDVSGSLAYVADRVSGMHVIDFSNPTAPQLIGSVDTPGFAVDVVVSSTHAFVADGSAGIQVVDIQDPWNPEIVQSISLVGYSNTLALSKNTLVASGGHDSYLSIIDITVELAPVVLGETRIPETAGGIVLVENIAYVFGDAFTGGDLHIVDFIDPTHPRIVGSFESPSEITGAAVTDSHLFIADYSSLYSLESLGMLTLPLHCRSATSIDEVEERIDSPRLIVYPNPAQGMTTIRLVTNSDSAMAVRIYDVAGRLVRTLHDGSVDAGVRDLAWDGRDTSGQRTAAGVYLVRVTTNEGESRERVTLLR